MLDRGAEKKKYVKHKNDIFRLTQLLTNGSPLTVSQSVIKELDAFVVDMEKEEVDLKAIGVSGKKEELLKLLKSNFVLKKM